MVNHEVAKVANGSVYVDKLEEMYSKHIEPALSEEEAAITHQGIDYVVDIIAYLWTAQEHSIKLPIEYKPMVLEFIKNEPNAIGLDEELDLDNMFT